MLYLDLFQALHDYQVKYLLVGGLAMNLHGVPRMTMDVDLILLMDESNLDRFIACAEAMHLSPVVPVPLQSLKDSAQRESWYSQRHMVAFGLQNNQARIPVMVDVLISPSIDVDQAFSRAITRDLNGLPVKLASVDDMIALKQGTGRRQDQSDIEHLERLRGE